MKHTSVIISDQPVTISVQADAYWFRLFRSVVKSKVWANLSDPARSVLVVLAEHVNDQIRNERGEWLAWPSVKTLADLSGFKVRAVQTALAELKERKLIFPRATGGGTQTTTYQLMPPPHGHAPLHDDAPGRCTTMHPTPARPCTQQRLINRDRLKETDNSGPAESSGVDPLVADVVADLLKMEVERKTAESLAAKYPAERIKAVIADALVKGDDPAAYVVAALKGDWKVGVKAKKKVVKPVTRPKSGIWGVSAAEEEREAAEVKAKAYALIDSLKGKL